MTPHTIPQTVLFPDLFDKPLVATFNQEHASSDGGAVLLKAAERVYGLVKAFARCLADKRAPGKIRHTLADLIGQRVFGIACGHPDGNDADHLADDPIHKLLLGRDPVSGAPLASQPTISRFEKGAALLRRRPKGLLPAARQELLDPSKAWWGGRRGRLADRPRYSISVSLGVVPRWYSRVVEVPVRIEVTAGFVAPGASEPPRLQPSWPPGGSRPAHG